MVIWTVEQVQALGTTTDVPTAGAVLGIGRTTAYQLAKAGLFPVQVLRIGRRLLVPVPPLLALLGVLDQREGGWTRFDGPKPLA